MSIVASPKKRFSTSSWLLLLLLAGSSGLITGYLYQDRQISKLNQSHSDATGSLNARISEQDKENLQVQNELQQAKNDKESLQKLVGESDQTHIERVARGDATAPAGSDATKVVISIRKIYQGFALVNVQTANESYTLILKKSQGAWVIVHKDPSPPSAEIKQKFGIPEELFS